MRESVRTASVSPNTSKGGALIGATSFDQSLSLLGVSPSFASSTG
jgi:hypothetical protein